MTLIVVSGSPGTGKSAVATALGLCDQDWSNQPGAPAAAVTAVRAALAR